jgi:hypothetical protein
MPLRLFADAVALKSSPFAAGYGFVVCFQYPRPSGTARHVDVAPDWKIERFATLLALEHVAAAERARRPTTACSGLRTAPHWHVPRTRKSPKQSSSFFDMSQDAHRQMVRKAEIRDSKRQLEILRNRAAR